MDSESFTLTQHLYMFSVYLKTLFFLLKIHIHWRVICAAVCLRFDIPVSKAKYVFCDFTSEEGCWNQNWYLPLEQKLYQNYPAILRCQLSSNDAYFNNAITLTLSTLSRHLYIM